MFFYKQVWGIKKTKLPRAHGNAIVQPVLILKSYSKSIKMLLKTDWWVLENFHRMKKMPVFGGYSLTTLKRRECWGFNKKNST